MVFNYRSEKYKIPYSFFKELIKKSSLDERDFSFNIVPHHNFKKKTPLRFNKELAEIVGIMLGDGCLHLNKSKKYNTMISLDKKEGDYANYIKILFSKFFTDYTFSIWECRNQLSIANTSMVVGKKLIDAGMHEGNKVKNKVTIPPWILTNKQFTKRVVRGLFDTDGCIYRKYANYAQIQFKFGCFETTTSIHEAVVSLGFNPTKIEKYRNKEKMVWAWKFYLSRQGEIYEFFKLIKPKNIKHLLRYKKIRSGDAGIRTLI